MKMPDLTWTVCFLKNFLGKPKFSIPLWKGDSCIFYLTSDWQTLLNNCNYQPEQLVTHRTTN